mgnify:FL=1
MKNIPIEKQLELARKAFGVIDSDSDYVKLVDHPSEDKKKAIAIDDFTISEYSFVNRVDSPSPGFHVDVARHVPGTRDYPPDVDIQDIGNYSDFFKALTKVAVMLAETGIQQLQENFGIEEMLEEEHEVDKQLKKRRKNRV